MSVMPDLEAFAGFSGTFQYLFRIMTLDCFSKSASFIHAFFGQI
jgi:hypothetical protein